MEPKPETTAVVQIAYAKTSLRERKTDFAYWQSQSYMARLAALEQTRVEYHRWRYGAEPGFQRVHSIVKR
jgi:hypothetical protein